MQQDNKIAVIGGTGKSGQYLVNQLLHQGFRPKLLIRNPGHLPAHWQHLETVTGDVTHYEAIYRLLEGCQAVISTLGLGIPPSVPTIFSQSTGHVLQVMQALGIHRYIVTTGLNVDTPFDQKSVSTMAATNWMKQTFPVSTADKQQEYELLAASTVDWTLVRLPQIMQTEESGDISISLQDCPGAAISATSLAHFLIGQLNSQAYLGQAPFIANA